MARRRSDELEFYICLNDGQTSPSAGPCLECGRPMQLEGEVLPTDDLGLDDPDEDGIGVDRRGEGDSYEELYAKETGKQGGRDELEEEDEFDKAA